MSFMPVYIAFH